MLARNDRGLSEDVYPLLERALNRADNMNTDASYAVLYECVHTIT